MRELQRKQRLKKILYSVPFLLLLVIFTILLLKGTFGVLLVERKSATKVDKLEEEAALLMERSNSLKEEIAALSTEEGIIEEIRKKFSAVRFGEYAALIIEPRQASSTGNSGRSWWEKIWHDIIRSNE